MCLTKRLENEQIFDEIREIRAGRRKFYQKIIDICEMAVDYSKDAITIKEFFKTVQYKHMSWISALVC